jgi:hypothetical protein
VIHPPRWCEERAAIAVAREERVRPGQPASGGIAGPTVTPVQPRGRRYEIDMSGLALMRRH